MSNKFQNIYNPPTRNAKMANPKSMYNTYLLKFNKPSVAEMTDQDYFWNGINGNSKEIYLKVNPYSLIYSSGFCILHIKMG